MRGKVPIIIIGFSILILMAVACRISGEPAATEIVIGTAATVEQILTRIPSETAYPEPESVMPTATAVGEDGYPYPGAQLPQPIVTATHPEGYPGPESQATESNAGLTQTATASDNAYPGPGEQPTSGATQSFQNPYPQPTDGAVATLTPLPTATSANGAYPSPEATATTGGALPTATSVATLTPLPTLSPTPPGQEALAPSPTPILVTPTLSPTPSPTPTQTPIPLPPWVQSNLHATDPGTVELASGKVQLIEFFAFWCGTCQALAPIVHGLEDEYGERMNFVYLDIDDPGTTTFKKALGYRYQPHFFLLDENGKILRQWLGYVTAQQLIEAIDAALR